MPRIIYGVALLRIAAWFILITFCVVCFEYSVAELNRIIRKSRPHFEGLTIDQTRDFLIVYLIFGVIYILIDGKWFYCCNTSIPIQGRRNWGCRWYHGTPCFFRGIQMKYGTTL